MLRGLSYNNMAISTQAQPRFIVDTTAEMNSLTSAPEGTHCFNKQTDQGYIKIGGVWIDLTAYHNHALNNLSEKSYNSLTDKPNIPAATEAFPIGSVFISVVSTNPSTLLGYGTWSAFGAGRVLVGLDSGDVNFDTVEETGGAKTVQSSAQAFAGTPANTSQADAGTTKIGTTSSTATLKAHTHSITPAGTNTPGAATSVVQPYIVVYMWKRTA